MATIEVEAIVATTEPIPGRGFRFAPEALEQMAAELRSGAPAMLRQHDIRQPMISAVLDAGVRTHATGYKELWTRFLVDEDQWNAYLEHLAATSAPGGFSIAGSEPLAELMATSGGAAAEVHLAADGYHWADETALDAGEILRVVGNVSVGRRFELAVDPNAVVYLGLVLNQVVLPTFDGVLGAALYDAMKRFLRPGREGRRTVFHFEIERPQRTVKAYLETDDSEVLKRAIDTFGQLAQQGGIMEWDAGSEGWRSLADRDEHGDISEAGDGGTGRRR